MKAKRSRKTKKPTIDQWFASQDKAVERTYRAIKRSCDAEISEANSIPKPETLSPRERLNGLRIKHSELVCTVSELEDLIRGIARDVDKLEGKLEDESDCEDDD